MEKKKITKTGSPADYLLHILEATCSDYLSHQFVEFNKYQ